MKDYLRDYTTEAFRFYARNGKSAEMFKRAIYLEALANECKNETGSSVISKPTEAAIMRAENAVNDKISEIYDMEAVDQVIAELKVNYKNEIAEAINIVYFTNPNNQLKKGDIQERVVQASMNVGLSEASIYRGLKKARILFAKRRGLRVEIKED